MHKWRRLTHEPSRTKATTQTNRRSRSHGSLETILKPSQIERQGAIFRLTSQEFCLGPVRGNQRSSLRIADIYWDNEQTVALRHSPPDSFEFQPLPSLRHPSIEEPRHNGEERRFRIAFEALAHWKEPTIFILLSAADSFNLLLTTLKNEELPLRHGIVPELTPRKSSTHHMNFVKRIVLILRK